MIKLKSLILENIDTSKIKWDVNDSIHTLTIRMLVDDYHCPFAKGFPGHGFIGHHPNLFGGIVLSKNPNMKQKSGYMIVSYVNVFEPNKGYGILLYKKAVEESKKNGYKGIASEKSYRTPQASSVWNRIKTDSDTKFDYLS